MIICFGNDHLYRVKDVVYCNDLLINDNIVCYDRLIMTTLCMEVDCLLKCYSCAQLNIKSNFWIFYSPVYSVQYYGGDDR
jgi:hypothetical protein